MEVSIDLTDALPFYQSNPRFSFQMLSGGLLWCLALLFLSHGVLTLTQRDGSQGLTHKRPHLVRQPRPDADSTAGPIPYIIIMNKSATREQVQEVNNRLLAEAVPGSLKAKTYKLTSLDLLFRADISSALANAIKKLPSVLAVSPDVSLEKEQPPTLSARPSLTPRGTFQWWPKARHKAQPKAQPKRKDWYKDFKHLRTVQKPAHVRFQEGATPDLKIISQPPGAETPHDLPGYAYAAAAGKGVTIYLIDTGANVDNPEWRNMEGNKTFIYLRDAEKTETDPDGHGSCIASKLTGPKYGVAKGANIVMLKWDTDAEITMYHFFEALVEVSNDVHMKNIRGKAVVNFSYGKALDREYDSFIIDSYELLLGLLEKDDIVFVTASGNLRTNKPLTTDIIIVGAVELDGSRSEYSQGTKEELATSAPGLIYCASNERPTTDQFGGTSLAAPAVAGVIAVWLSQDEHAARLQVPGKVAANVKAMVKEFSYPRIENGWPVIWNGVDPRGLICDKPPTGSDGAGSVCRVTVDSHSWIRPPRPPRTKWSENPQGYEPVFEQDGFIPVDQSYIQKLDNTELKGESSFDQLCMDKCTG
ncbi:Subtilisin-like protease 2 [Colletotrichum tanaceti]|nr:Subtilisin-like protease 2 [Colletotrichum tanaceti]